MVVIYKEESGYKSGRELKLHRDIMNRFLHKCSITGMFYIRYHITDIHLLLK